MLDAELRLVFWFMVDNNLALGTYRTIVVKHNTHLDKSEK